MYFDAAVVFVTKSSLFFRLAVAILCTLTKIADLVVVLLSRERGSVYVHQGPLITDGRKSNEMFIFPIDLR